MAGRYFVISVSQQEYIQDIAWQYSAVDPSNTNSTLPKSVVFEVQFITYDPTDRDNTETFDFFTLEIKSNGKNSLSEAVCDFAGVALSSDASAQMNDRTYQVKSNTYDN
jgi:hypothetical protein